MTKDREGTVEERFDPAKNLKYQDSGVDKLGRLQLFASATSVYLHKDGKTLLMRQTKDHRVVGDNYVGIGGKDLLNTYFGDETGEKEPTEVVVSSMLAGKFGSKHTPEELAIKEVEEETTLSLNREKLKPIGCSEVKLLNEKSNEWWQIFYFNYELSDSEAELIKMYCDEGIFEWVDDRELLDKEMLPADRIILQNQNPDLLVEAIYDDFNNIHQLRTESPDFDKEEKVCILYPDYKKMQEFFKKTVPFRAAERALNELGVLR
jgi:hypothetical protein